MKKIYTITFHEADNYGALLQAYALQVVISKKYNTEILNYSNKTIADSYNIFKRRKGLKNQVIQFIKDLINLKKELIRKKNFSKFRDNIKISKPLTSKSLTSIDDCDSIYITGSDQVWNEELIGDIDDVYFLKGMDKNTISYAASVGSVSSIKNKAEFLDAVKNIKHISVREDTLKKYLDESLSINTKKVLDPSLLLDKSDWDEISGDKRIVKEKYMFVYCGDEPSYFYDLVNDIASKENLTIVYSGRRDKDNRYKHKKKSFYELGPSEFVNLIKYSECVVTPSFHGTALSVVYNKRLYAVPNRSSDRLVTLLNRLKLENCIFGEKDKYTTDIRVDWARANSILSRDKKDSVKWLYDAIEDCK